MVDHLRGGCLLPVPSGRNRYWDSASFLLVLGASSKRGSLWFPRLTIEPESIASGQQQQLDPGLSFCASPRFPEPPAPAHSACRRRKAVMSIASQRDRWVGSRLCFGLLVLPVIWGWLNIYLPSTGPNLWVAKAILVAPCWDVH